MNKEREIFQAIIDICNTSRNNRIMFSIDWGGNSLTVYSDGLHTHCGSPEGTYEQLINDLHGALVKG